MPPLDANDTIAAVASPPGPGVRGIVRLSGPDAWRVGLSGFTPDATDDLSAPGRSSRVAGIYRLDGLRPALPAELVLWPGPRTYTGQPVVEAHTYGSPPLLQRLLAHYLAIGARLAEPGEFTLRAFLSGRLDLTRAEAVLGVIDARNPAQLDAALRQLAGGIFVPIAALRDRLLDGLAHLEAGLDFVDEQDVDPLGRLELAGLLAEGSTDLAALAARLSSRERPESRPTVVLVGPPNAGKSRLFNALVGSARALVSPVPGTTRDYVSAAWDCDSLEIDLIDTAGMEAPRDPIEARAQILRDAQTARADLWLVCDPADGTPLALVPDRPFLRIRTRCDLARPGLPADPDALTTSAVTGEGLDSLRRAVASRLRDTEFESNPTTTTGARCRDSLTRASDALARASNTLALGGGDELVAADLREALDDLGRVVGAVVTDDILDRIFQKFCIGK